MSFSICCRLKDFFGDVVYFLWLQVYPSVTFSLLIWVAAMLSQLWNLNFYVPQSGAVQNIYKSPHVTLIINLNRFARMR